MNTPLSNHFLDGIFTSDPYTKKYYKGSIYPRGNPDIKKIISKIKPIEFYILNTDYYTNPGIHWCLIAYFKKYTVFIDPFGLPPYVYNLPFLIEYKINPVRRNIFTVQNFNSRSIACGHFVIIYGLLLARGYSLYKINSFFDPKNTYLNDQIALDFVSWLKNTYYKNLTL